jgi:hypothetical protein
VEARASTLSLIPVMGQLTFTIVVALLFGLAVLAAFFIHGSGGALLGFILGYAAVFVGVTNVLVLTFSLAIFFDSSGHIMSS